MSRWLGPLAGLAIGAGLASLFMNNGMAGAMGGILMIVLLAAAAMFAWRMLSAKSAGSRLQYAGADPAGAPAAMSGMPRIGSAAGGAAATAPVAGRYPPGFDAEQFARHAKMNFNRLQQANDKRDLSTMRDYMTPQLYSEIVATLDPMGPLQHTEVISLDADVVEVVTENDRHIASVRFTGNLREQADPATETFDEIWHLEKPVSGASGWLISGIQQA
jgi:predicted lipid-binding transport protein (Tim44 family)